MVCYSLRRHSDENRIRYITDAYLKTNFFEQSKSQDTQDDINVNYSYFGTTLKRHPDDRLSPFYIAVRHARGSVQLKLGYPHFLSLTVWLTP